MTKSVDKYEILDSKPLVVDSSNFDVIQVEYYVAKEKQGSASFVLKRVKTHNIIQTTAVTPNSVNEITNEPFELLKNQTLILKTLDYISIPKCLRILKTTNSIYFVYETYSLISLQDYLIKKVIGFQKKVTISLNIINAVNYVHKQSVAWRGINERNVKIDTEMNVFMTDFTQAIYFQTKQQKLKSINQHKRQHQLKSLQNQDLLDLAKLIFQIFHFDKIDHKSHHFVDQKEQKLYEALSQGLQRKFTFITVQNLTKILTKKEKLKTKTCVSTQQSFESVSTNNPQKCQKIHKNIFDVPNQRKFSMEFTNANRAKNQQKTAAKIESAHFIQLSSNKTILTLPSLNYLKEQKLSFSDQLHSAVQRLQRQKQKEREQIKKKMQSILTTRKIINLILHILQKISQYSEQNLIFLLALKCESLAFNEQKEIQLCFLQSISSEQKQSLKQLKKQNIKTIITLQIVKQSIRQLMKQCDSFEQKQSSDIFQFIVGNSSVIQQKVQQKLSKAIYQFLDKELSSFGQKYKEIDQKNDKKHIDDNSIQLYEKFRLFYYSSIKLKHGSFEEFFEKKKNNFKTSQLNILKEEYFSWFENCKIPLRRIINEVFYRMEIASKS